MCMCANHLKDETLFSIQKKNCQFVEQSCWHPSNVHREHFIFKEKKVFNLFTLKRKWMAKWRRNVVCQCQYGSLHNFRQNFLVLTLRSVSNID